MTIGNRPGASPRPSTLWALLALLAAEFLLLAVVVVTLLVDLLVAPATSLAAAIALFVLALLALAWLGAVLAAMWRGRAWSRSAALVWQVLQFAVGLGALQGAFAAPEWGWPLVVASVAGFVLCISPPVRGALSGR